MTPASLFKTLADDTRQRCLALLLREGELCVCELQHALVLGQPKVSRHLRVLKDAALVDDRRAGLWVYYRLNEDLPPWLSAVMDAAADGLGATLHDDRRRLRGMPGRPGRCATPVGANTA